MLVGVLGGGQLGRMLGLMGIALGIDFRFWDPSPDAPAASTGEHICAPYDDQSAISRFASGLDVITYEFENIPAETLDRLVLYGATLGPKVDLQIRPGIRALEVSQDRAGEKRFFAEVGVPTGEWMQVDSLELVKTAFELFGPCIVKTRRFGYDGKGQYRINSADDCEPAWTALGENPLIAEKLVKFDRELSLVGVRGTDGEIRTWPLVENVHIHGILHSTTAPAPDVSEQLQKSADAMLRSIMEALGYVGVLTVELFDVGGQLIANEMAPRVHNSGHWTIEGAVTCQFENHVRAVTGLPLGSTRQRCSSVMLNCIGSMPPAEEVLKIEGVHLHDYGKLARAGRKVGHITVCDEPGGGLALSEKVAKLEELLSVSRIKVM